MILGQPVHIDDNVETTEFNWHEIDFERHDIQLLLVVDYFQWLASCFGSSCSNGTLCCKYYICQYKLVIVVAIVGVGVAVVVVAAGVV
ncbi:hypothetical protein Tco_1037507, partial [Tanacetum coccineum]